MSSAAAATQSNVFYVTDCLSKVKFLVDTGAAKSVLPLSYKDDSCTQLDNSLSLVAANGSPIKLFGQKILNVQFGGCDFTWSFLIADVNQPIIGSDFLVQNEFLVDVAQHRLLKATDFSSISLQPQAGENIDLKLVFTEKYFKLLNDFPELTTPQFKSPTVSHGIEHHIETRGPPVWSRPRRLSPEKLAIAEKEFREMEEMGIIRPSSSPWASPLHMVPKANGEWRPCGDYRRLNQRTIADKYPIPLISDCTAKLFGSSIFSKIDLIRGYFQVPVHPDSIPKTAITTPFGAYEFLRMSFGLRNAAQTFMRVMHKALHGLDFVFVYLDDILVFSTSDSEHENHLKTIFERLREHGLMIKMEKCVFGKSEIEFLGHMIDSKGIRPLPQKVQAILDFPEPKTLKESQCFAGLINYYHKFIPNAARIMAPIYATIGSRRIFSWSDQQTKAFNKAKKALSDAVLLSHPVHGAELCLKTDASDTAIGSVLEQIVNGASQPLAFFSRKLREAELKYSAFDKELLSAFLSVRHFRHYLEGRSFTLYTDHKPLVQAIDRIGDPMSNRQKRQLSELSEYCITMKHLSGVDNVVADALSRLHSISIGIDFEELAKAQNEEFELMEFYSNNSSLKLDHCKIPGTDTDLICDVSLNRPRPIVPFSFRKQIFTILHSTGHPSIRSTKRLITERFIWHGMKKDISGWARSCQNCQKSKVYRHTKSSTETMSNPVRRFSSLHLDIVGPLPISNGFRYLLTVIDRTSRWAEVLPISEATARECAQAFLHGWIARFGVPEDLVCDRGPQFTSEFWINLNKLMGVTVHHTTSYHPESNGVIERFHRHLKSVLMARMNDDHDWFQHLPWTLLSLRSTPKEGTGISSAERLYGEPLVVPGEFFPSSGEDLEIQRLRDKVGSFSPIPPPRKCKSYFVPKSLQNVSHVFVRIDSHRIPLTRPYQGPFLVLDRSEKAMLLALGNRRDWVSIDRCKPAFLDELQTSSGRLVLPPARY